MQFLSNDAQNEWLAEMFVAAVAAKGLAEVKSRWNKTDSAVDVHQMFSELLNCVMELHDGFSSVQDAEKAMLLQILPPEVCEILNNPLTSTEQRRATCLQIASKMGNREQLLEQMLKIRARLAPESLRFSGALSKLSNSDRPNSQKGLWTWQSPAGQPPVEIEFIAIDGLWKIDTVFDPAFSPSPVVTAPPDAPPDAPTN
jgi:hypothetical protein